MEEAYFDHYEAWGEFWEAALRPLYEVLERSIFDWERDCPEDVLPGPGVPVVGEGRGVPFDPSIVTRIRQEKNREPTRTADTAA